MESIKNYLRKGLQQRETTFSEQSLDTACNLLAALFEGLTIRLIRNPDLSLQHSIPMMRRIIRYMLEQEIPETASR